MPVTQDILCMAQRGVNQKHKGVRSDVWDNDRSLRRRLKN